jgi:hypothetical protein
MPVSCSSLFFYPEDGGNVPKRQLNFNGPHGVISQKTALFVTTAAEHLKSSASVLAA